MAEGVEFLRAFARFFVDRQDFDRTLTTLEADAARSARTVEQALRMAPVAQELGRGAEATRRFTTAHVELTRTIKQVAAATATELNPALGQALDALRNAAQAGRAFGVGLGVAVGALTVASVAVGVWIQRVREAREAQVALNLAAQRLEFGAARGEIDRALTELERLAQLQREVEAGVAAGPLSLARLRGLLAFVEAQVGPEAAALEARLRQAQQIARTAFQVFERPRLERGAEAEQVAVERQLAELAGRRAETGAEILAAAERVAAALGRQAAIQAQLVELDARRQAFDLRRQGLVAEAARVEQLGAVRARALREAAQAQAEHTLAAERRRAAELEALARDAEARQAERLARRARAELEAAQETLAAERRLEEARAEAAGRAARGLAVFQAERRRLTEEAVAAELAGLARVTAARRAALEARLAGAEGEERVRLAQQLAEVTAEAEEARLEIERRAARARRQLAVQEFEERQRALRQALSLEDQAFEHRRRMGEVTVQEELAALTRRTQDVRRTEQERAQAAEEVRARLLALDEQVFEARRALGQATLADEAARARALVDLTRAGTEARLAAERRLAEAVTRLRQETLAAGQAALGFAQAVFGERGFTRAELEQQFAERQRRAEEVRRRFERGGRVRAQELREAFEVAGLGEQLAGLGLAGPGAALREGLAAAFTTVREQLAGLGQETITALTATLGAAAREAGVPLVTAYQEAFADILRQLDAFVATFEQRLAAGQGRIAARLGQRIYDDLVARLEREALRG